MPARTPTVFFSVIMPTYNRAFCIGRAIDALLAQTHQDFELIVVDDGSTDGTAELIQSKYADALASGKLVFLPQEKNAGVCAARNKGLEKARYAWIAYADTDNVPRPDFLETFANGIILQIMRMMYLAAATENESNCWVIDVNCTGYDNIEAKKCAVAAFKHNEEVISTYLYRGLDEYRQLLDDSKSDQALIKDAANDSYRLFRKLGKMIGVIIPNTGKGIRFSLSEDIIKFLVLSIIPPKQMITLDEFVHQLYLHFGMVIGPEQYKAEMKIGAVMAVGDYSFLEANLKAFAQKLKDCGFLRDLSDATAIVENPYEKEDSAK